MAEHRESATDGEERRAEFVTQIFERFRRPLLRYLKDLLSRREDAEDVLQDTYARLLTVTDLERSVGRVRAYVFKIATNLAYDRFRQRRAHGEHTEDGLAGLVAAEPSPDGVVAFEQGLAIVKRALLELKPRCRQVFLLRSYSELSYEEIGRRLGLSKRTVEREMQHALDVCQKRLRSGNEP